MIHKGKGCTYSQLSPKHACQAEFSSVHMHMHKRPKESPTEHLQQKPKKTGTIKPMQVPHSRQRRRAAQQLEIIVTCNLFLFSIFPHGNFLRLICRSFILAWPGRPQFLTPHYYGNHAKIGVKKNYRVPDTLITAGPNGDGVQYVYVLYIRPGVCTLIHLQREHQQEWSNLNIISNWQAFVWNFEKRGVFLSKGSEQRFPILTCGDTQPDPGSLTLLGLWWILILEYVLTLNTFYSVMIDFRVRVQTKKIKIICNIYSIRSIFLTRCSVLTIMRQPSILFTLEGYPSGGQLYEILTGNPAEHEALS